MLFERMISAIVIQWSQNSSILAEKELTRSRAMALQIAFCLFKYMDPV
jgi:hypothetical protein